jgi:outer membrane protein
MTAWLFRSAVVGFLVASLVIGAPAYAQQQGQSQDSSQSATQSPRQAPPPVSFRLSDAPDYSKGKRPFPNLLSPYAPITVPEPVLTNSPRIDQLIHDGKLMLSLSDAISLALENNLDISIQRFVPWILETDILRTKAGGAARGIGGTGTASTLGAIPAATFDPILTVNLNAQHSTIPINNPFTAGTGSAGLNSITSNTSQGNISYSQGFHTGTAVSVTFNNARNATTSPGALTNPSVQSSLFFSVQQQLLNGFGLLPNTRFILEALNSKKVGELTFTLQVITTVSAVENQYWELVFARENVKVQEAALGTSQKLYQDNKRQLEIGTMAPLDVLTAESEEATDRQNLIVAQTARLQQQTLMLNLITKNPMEAGLVDVEIVPTDSVSDLPQVESLPLQDAVKEAWQKRPEIHQFELNLKNAGIEVRATRNALLPTLTVFAQYGSNGLAGNSLTGTNSIIAGRQIVDINGNPLPDTGGVPEFVPSLLFTPTGKKFGGLDDSVSQVFNQDFRTYSAGMTFTLPVRNRSAQADSARALLDERQLQTQYRQQENQIVVDVRNAQIALVNGLAQVEAAQKARELAVQTLDAEKKKYQLGASTSYNVILRSRDLTTAQGNELRAKANLQEAEVAYEKALGRTLERNNITIADAKKGQTSRVPLIPGTLPTEAQGGSK